VYDAVLMQMDVNNKRETEFRKLKRDLEDTQAQRDSQLAALRKKNQEVVNELNEQVDQLQKAKQKYAARFWRAYQQLLLVPLSPLSGSSRCALRFYEHFFSSAEGCGLSFGRS